MQSNYEKLIVWQKAVDLSVYIYKITANFPKEELYGLVSQIRRSSVSISSNIAEGAERNSKGEFKQFLGIAKGSAGELKTQLIISHKLAYFSKEIFDDLIFKLQEILMMLSKLIYTL
ncbi:MAG: hypothetical protein UR28_C0011G0029 [Candidatus Peregrinibacteria bacterium GW2011_GWF2_33_10]|nr:MAG: hypothetical protein UR28_C0011G0029 [Candidatus Peregrinibacteria bacterium GW2011_GWF2_33_10]OGJ44680.1 MAG: four helix bundle protein [Candidatus Peregrinibacteria bacterium RIFOXYA2_FULL_33_21]OGJ45652.1 MAG: four helix bundle protein [Candidatus Peregrinibacteria bacterium RIFOXYA12_FULL_33_12]OGJ50414.1 MAG: four helix bundle protein [Candidatus Peregrinibacteria bacterium RIFOXYB2_FULL_33_20]